MKNNVYDRLITALDNLPNGFPRTASGIEKKLLQKIFSPEDAEIAGQLGENMEPLSQIAQRIRLPAQQARKKLMKLVRLGVVWFEKDKGVSSFRLVPFVVGIYEAQLNIMDHELAHLVEDYMEQGGAAVIMGTQPALTRVIPAQSAIKSEIILPYDDVKKILLQAKTFRVRDCICRVQKKHLGRECEFPLQTCLTFSSFKYPSADNDISQEQALSILDKAEKTGLVHTVSNFINKIGYLCNCCGCCCGILRRIKETGFEKSIAYANYYAVIDSNLCRGCQLCLKRCPSHAISLKNRVASLLRKKCIGCGLCATGCQHKAISLIRRPEPEITHPPLDYQTWSRERLINRGLLNLNI